MTALIDTSFLLTLQLTKHPNFTPAWVAMRQLTGRRIIAAPVLPELFYMTTARAAYTDAIKGFHWIRTSAFQVEPLTMDDMARMQDIMAQYQAAQFDFVDTAIMALAERLNVTQIYTFDRRDFGAFQPTHCEYLDLLP